MSPAASRGRTSRLPQLVSTASLTRFVSPFSGSPFTTATSDTILTGWTIGGGIEYRVYGNWLVRGEYRYSNFGTWTGNIFNLTGPAPIGTLVGHSLKVNTQIATGGIGYKF
jgi:outer membrane immunogenic protein